MARRRSRSALRSVVVRSAAVVLLVGTSPACLSNNATIERLTIVNRTRYDLEIRVTDAARDGWIVLGRTLRGARTDHELIADLGDVWIFRFEYAAKVLGGELRVDRTQLVQNRWTVEVPDDVDDALERAGIEPSPA
jgi:hypothetical protein